MAELTENAVYVVSVISKLKLLIGEHFFVIFNPNYLWSFEVIIKELRITQITQHFYTV